MARGSVKIQFVRLKVQRRRLDPPLIWLAAERGFKTGPPKHSKKTCTDSAVLRSQELKTPGGRLERFESRSFSGSGTPLTS